MTEIRTARHAIEILESPTDIPGVSRVIAMQHLIDNGVVWNLRRLAPLAEWLIDEGLCTPKCGCGRRLRDMSPLGG